MGAVVGAVVGAGSVAGGSVSGGRVAGGSVRSGSLGAVVGLDDTGGKVGTVVGVGLVVGPDTVDAGAVVESVVCVGMFT